VGPSFTAYGTYALDLGAAPQDANDPYVEAWVTAGGTRYDATDSSLGSSSWQADFAGIPTGTGSTLNVVLHYGGTPYPAPPVGLAGVSNTTGIGGIGGGPSPPRAQVGAGADRAKAGRKPAAAAPPKPIHVHHTVSGGIPDDVMRRLRGISAAYFVDGVQLTRVFDAQLDALDGDYQLRMNLRRAADVRKPGSIVFRIEFWPTGVVTTSISNLIVVE
jgi:hypothetical protein